MGVHSDYLLDTPLSRAPLSTCLRVTTRNRIDTTRLSTCFTAFSPDPDSAPIHDDLPFNLVRGEVVLDETAYDRYLDVLPIRRCTALARHCAIYAASRWAWVWAISSFISQPARSSCRSALVSSAYRIVWMSTREITASGSASGWRVSFCRGSVIA